MKAVVAAFNQEKALVGAFSVITNLRMELFEALVQAPAGIGKSSMLKYMCLQWSEGELWTSNFDILIFIECRTLNHLGAMSCRDFLRKHVEYVLNKIDPEADVVADIEAVASRGRLLFLIDGLDEVCDAAENI